MAAMFITFGVSCANPPGSDISSGTQPHPSDSVQETTAEASSDPVDLSVLTEEERDKFLSTLLYDLKTADPDVPIKIDITLHSPMTSAEFDAAVEARLEYNAQRRTEINAEIADLQEQKDSLLQVSGEAELNAQSQSSAAISEIDNKISELNEEYEEHSLVYNNGVNQVIATEHRPLLEAFMDKYGLESEGDRYLSAIMTIEHVYAKPAQIIEIAKNSDVQFLNYPKDIGNPGENF